MCETADEAGIAAVEDVGVGQAAAGVDETGEDVGFDFGAFGRGFLGLEDDFGTFGIKGLAKAALGPLGLAIGISQGLVDAGVPSEGFGPGEGGVVGDPGGPSGGEIPGFIPALFDQGDQARNRAAALAAERARFGGTSLEERQATHRAAGLERERRRAAERAAQETADAQAATDAAELTAERKQADRKKKAEEDEDGARRRARGATEPLSLLTNQLETAAQSRFATSPLGLLTNPNVGRPRLLGS